jgi:glycosyltransferase involved in cell wall biosynthesis
MLAVRHGVENQFHPARNPHLIEDAQQILLDGGFAEPQFDSDSTVGQANAALFVLPSELEGLSLALLDAMAAGVCVLASDIPENNEVVDGAGFTFQRGDQADVERMLDLLPRKQLREAVGQTYRQRFPFSLIVVALGAM